MSEIHIERNHGLGLAAAREVARQWMQQAEQDYGMECTYAEGEVCDVAQFNRAGIDGSVEVSADTFTLNATLGFLYGSFSEQIEQRLLQSLDALLGAKAPADDDAYNDKDWL
ncbi:polyhydroxyalkanoic acid system family protein [Variovorax sp. J2P1-59]|uniref:polyhydroxyalkanoic acid system family protein n=1 Tax=Variovorax flavidus TaxID=3053501 RepID=UPI002575617E|nr:polyhydroxyalkanoic acid system family protein [Variovorax sp. J2P1-59]MDM0077399.1 polyhydroxyalkanoic acid system family protein [Variovorax sp. J2P1-59]